MAIIAYVWSVIQPVGSKNKSGKHALFYMELKKEGAWLFDLPCFVVCINGAGDNKIICENLNIQMIWEGVGKYYI